MKNYRPLYLSSIAPQSLVWKQPKFGADYYVLVDESAGDALYASIGWPKWLSDRAVARSEAGTWYFDRAGWTRRTIKVTRPVAASLNSGAENHPAVEQIASFEVGIFWDGDLVLRGGEVFHWYRTKTWQNTWAMTQVLSDLDSNQAAETAEPDEVAKVEKKRRGFRFGKQKKPKRREKLVYEIEFGWHWFKQQAWIRLPASQAVQPPEPVFLLCTGMYLGYCLNQDSGAAVAVSSTAAIT
jgi:hypothetical protein